MVENIVPRLKCIVPYLSYILEHRNDTILVLKFKQIHITTWHTGTVP